MTRRLSEEMALGLRLRHAGKVRGRYAPSPTGELHLGNLRTALFAWLHARCFEGVILLRVEDLDRERCKEGFEAQMLDDLELVGLDFDEGVREGGPCAPLHSAFPTFYAWSCWSGHGYHQHEKTVIGVLKPCHQMNQIVGSVPIHLLCHRRSDHLPTGQKLV